MKKLLAPLALAAALATGCGQEKTCAPDARLCSDTCVSVQSDPRNCGACGHACGVGQGCSAGACVDCLASPGACVAEVVAACSNLNQVRPLGLDLAPSNVPADTDLGPISFARLGSQLYVANSSSSTISAVTVDPPSATHGAGAIAVSSGNAGFGDLEHLAAHGGLLWASNAATGTLVAVDPASGPIDEIALAATPGEFTNPQGIDFVGTKGYLALAGANALVVLDLSTVPGGRVVKRIDLAPLAFGTASAAPSRVVAVNGRVYVTLNDLFDATFVPVPGAHGLLAVVDATTDTLLTSLTVDLGAGCLNPSGMALSGSTLWIGCGFFDFFGTKAVSGAAFVPVDVGGATPVPGTPILLANAATSVAFCDGRGYAGASDSGTVLSFDPVGRTVITALACPPRTGGASFVPDLACAR